VSRADGVRLTKSRFASKPLTGKSASLPPFDHPALVESRTIYPSTVRAGRDRWALKSGENSAKIGGLIMKGRWTGFPVYTLTLEERATCPTSCHHWRSCYGNSLHFADRVAAGPDLEWRLPREIALLETYHPDGFVVRLHVLGDFYSVEYVDLWARLLERHPALRVFGYTARHDKDDPIAAALKAVVDQHWDRFAVRFSNAPSDFGAPATISVEHPLQARDAVVCPEQLGRTESCSTCALCWQSRKRIAFIQH
jgi:hypothetical protein